MKKGSAEAKEFMARIRAMRKGGSKAKEDEKMGMEMKGVKDSMKRVGRLVKGSAEAKAYMAKIRSMKK